MVTPSMKPAAKSGNSGKPHGSGFDVEVSNSYSALSEDTQKMENLPATRIRRPTQKAQEAHNQAKKKKGSDGVPTSSQSK